jgi:hypothetical protein
VGPDGNLWFTEASGNRIGRITPLGVITEFPVPTTFSDLSGITAGPDGNLWFTEFSGNKIGRITPSGVITEFPVPFASGGPVGITAGPDGNLWFTEMSGNKIGRVNLTPPPPPAVSVTANAESFRSNELLDIDVTVTNLGAPVVIDAYFGVLLPSAAGPGLGCPGGDAVAFLTAGFSGVQITCLSAPPQSFQPLASNVTLPGGLPSTILTDFFTFTWTGAEPPGPYTFFLALTPAGAFADGQIDLLAVGQQTVTFVP